MDLSDKAALYMQAWRDDWCKFCSDVLKARLDKEQQDIIHSVQYNRMTAVASGTARGKDFCAACAAMCFMYLTPRWVNGRLVKNTKIAMTAPSGRQVKDIMIPEVSRLFRNAGFLPGRLLSSGIRTNYEEWFLTGFKSSDDNMEAWSGFHAVNTLFVVTEASGISEVIYNAIEGNLQGNSRLLIVFNPNVTTGYAARAMKSDRFAKFRLSSLNAENVVSLLLLIIAFVVNIVNFFRTGRLNNSAKKYIKETLEEMPRDLKRPVHSQSFTEERDDYVLNTVTNMLEKSPVPVNVQKKIQGYVGTCLENVLNALLHPEEFEDGDNVTLQDSVASRNDMLEDLSYAGEMFDIAEEYRERFNLSPDMSVQDIFKFVQTQADEMGERLKNQGQQEVENNAQTQKTE